jgi:hypothetical protein
MAKGLNDEILKGVQEIEDFREEMKRILENERDGPEIIRGQITMEARKLNEQIQKHFQHQKAENHRMQNYEVELKGDMTAIHQALIGKIFSRLIGNSCSEEAQ